jgi:hypothetical protein
MITTGFLSNGNREISPAFAITDLLMADPVTLSKKAKNETLA